MGASSGGTNGGDSDTGGTSSDGGQVGTGSGGSSGGGTGAGGSGGAGQSGGSGGAGSGGDGAGGGDATACTRELLDEVLDDYFAALGAGDPAGLPLAVDMKFTENAQIAALGSTEFWMNAGEVKYSQRALDTQACSVAAQAVVPEGSVDLPIAVRIKVEAAEITEIETVVVRQGDYTADFAVDNDPDEIIEIAPSIGWHDPVPESERATYEELVAWIDKYFRMFPNGVCNVTDECQRRENGGGDFSCSSGAQCSPGAPDPNDATLTPRVILADVERGIAIGLTNFEYFGSDGHLDMHMIKMSGGEVHAVQAILRDTDGQSGWE